ncbi:MAG: cytochrome-c peroxidase [Flavobacteriales bacterium]
MYQRIIHICFSFSLLLGISACNKQENLEPEKPFGFQVPKHFPPAHYKFGPNNLTKEGFELGRRLFFDPILSRNNSISCSSCHAQVHAFADHGTSLSFGVDNRMGTRNSMPMFNLAWHTSFMWDGGINHIEMVPIAPITNPVEMDETMLNVLQKLRNNPTYLSLFEKAFGSKEINDQRVLWALAQYSAMLISANSKYDQVKLGKAFFTPDEEHGYQIFKQFCNDCHREPLFSDFSFRNNGLMPEPHELGRMLITQREEDYYKFKVPSLRNLQFTHPYMHDGRFFTLHEVLDHYTNGISQIDNVDPLVKNGIHLDEQQRRDLIRFLQTLNDFDFIGDPMISEPILTN